MNRTALMLALGLAAGALAACDRDDETLLPVAAPSEAATTVIPRSLVWDPSLPDASKVFAQADQAKQSQQQASPQPPAQQASQAKDNSGGQDTRANDPMGSLSKHEEKNEMPKGGQVNNYSTPSIEGGSKR